MNLAILPPSSLQFWQCVMFKLIHEYLHNKFVLIIYIENFAIFEQWFSMRVICFVIYYPQAFLLGHKESGGYGGYNYTFAWGIQLFILIATGCKTYRRAVRHHFF